MLPVINISAGGLLLRAEHGEAAPLQVDDRAVVHLDVSEVPEPITVTMEACVVRIVTSDTAPTSVAVMWTSVSSQAVMQLAKLLEFLRARQ